MRKSRAEAAATRQRIVDAASTEFRRNGIDGTGLSDLMATAGLTHGGFYKHFDSKEELVNEACTRAMDSSVDPVESPLWSRPGRAGLQAALAEYLSADHRDNVSLGCAFVALGSELARSSGNVRDTATAGFIRFSNIIASHLDGLSPAAAKKQALVILSTMIGALTMARVVTDAELSDTLLREARRQISESLSRVGSARISKSVRPKGM